MTDLRDDPRFIMLMDAYVEMLALDASLSAPDMALTRQINALRDAIECEFGQGALDEANDWPAPPTEGRHS